jgi:hypothetical protein
MPLSPDQKAILQLLLERRQSYADIAAVLGGDPGQVRSRARTALSELAGADPDRRVGLTDYLLGQADPIGRADAVRHLREDPDDHQLALELSGSLRELFPAAELPRLPGEPRPARSWAPRGRLAPPRLPGAETARGGPLPSRRSRIIATAAIAAVVVLGVVLAVSGAFDGDGGEAASDSTEAASTASDGTAGDSGSGSGGTPDEEIERVALEPLGGGDASGEAVFGLATGDQPFAEISIRGLDPAPQDRTYVIWLMLNPEQGYPLSPINVSPEGAFTDRFAIPAAVLPVVARVRFVDVSIAPTRDIARLVRQAIENQDLVLTEPGEVVLRGEIPGAAGGN